MGVFNRITYPAFLIIPGLSMLPHFWRRFGILFFIALRIFVLTFAHRPFTFLCIGISIAIHTLVGIYIDTDYYKLGSDEPTIVRVFTNPVFTPLNNLRYNSQVDNLAEHGLHARYQHFFVNMLELLGPAYVLVLLAMVSRKFSRYVSLRSLRALSALSAIGLLSIFPHQEARFLLPCVPLMLTCIRKPLSRQFYMAWAVFNIFLGALMGMYHQGGVIPTQLQIPRILDEAIDSKQIAPGAEKTANVIWWKTYMPPNWLLGSSSAKLTNLNIQTVDMKGISGLDMMASLETLVPQCDGHWPNSTLGLHHAPTLLVAPASNTFIDSYVAPNDSEKKSESAHLTPTEKIQLHLLYSYKNHINLDDLDFGDDGIFPTLRRVIGRRGLNVWLVQRDCESKY